MFLPAKVGTSIIRHVFSTGYIIIMSGRFTWISLSVWIVNLQKMVTPSFSYWVHIIIVDDNLYLRSSDSKSPKTPEQLSLSYLFTMIMVSSHSSISRSCSVLLGAIEGRSQCSDYDKQDFYLHILQLTGKVEVVN